MAQLCVCYSSRPHADHGRRGETGREGPTGPLPTYLLRT